MIARLYKYFPGTNNKVETSLVGILGRAEGARGSQAPCVEQEERRAAASPLLHAGEQAPPLHVVLDSLRVASRSCSPTPAEGRLCPKTHRSDPLSVKTFGPDAFTFCIFSLNVGDILDFSFFFFKCC